MKNDSTRSILLGDDFPCCRPPLSTSVSPLSAICDEDARSSGKAGETRSRPSRSVASKSTIRSTAPASTSRAFSSLPAIASFLSRDAASCIELSTAHRPTLCARAIRWCYGVRVFERSRLGGITCWCSMRSCRRSRTTLQRLSHSLGLDSREMLAQTSNGLLMGSQHGASSPKRRTIYQSSNPRCRANRAWLGRV